MVRTQIGTYLIVVVTYTQWKSIVHTIIYYLYPLSHHLLACLPDVVYRFCPSRSRKFNSVQTNKYHKCVNIGSTGVTQSVWLLLPLSAPGPWERYVFGREEISEGGFEREVILYSSLFSPRPTKPPHIHCTCSSKEGCAV